VPLLQPLFVKTGTTSSRKLTGRVSVACATSIGIATAAPSKLTRSSVAPSASGWTVVADSSRARVGSAISTVAAFVTSLVVPSSHVACATKPCASLAPESESRLG
jgi:hypothetical protein